MDGIKILINFIVWANFHLPKQLTVLPLFVTCAPRHQSKKMEDKAVAVAAAAEEAPFDKAKKADDEAKAAEPKEDEEDAPAPPAAGDATAEASDKKEDDDAKASTDVLPKDVAKAAACLFLMNHAKMADEDKEVRFYFNFVVFLCVNHIDDG